MKKVILLFSCVLLSVIASAQSISINTNKNPPDSSAIVDIQSNQKGLLIPRMTAIQRNAIYAPANGLLVFDTDSATLFMFTGSWKKIQSISSGTNPGDMLRWDGTKWSVVPQGEFFTYYYRDKDGDGFGDKFFPVAGTGTTPLEGFVSSNQDCDDGNPSVNPNKVWYIDGDGDGFGSSAGTVMNCTKPTGYQETSSDCNDTNPNIHPNAPDSAGDLIDSDCDGIDGKETAGVFVSTTGNNSNDGTKNAPLATIDAGLAKASATGKTQVYIAGGTYNERVNLVNGISLYGSYTANWSRSATATTIITVQNLPNQISKQT